MPEVARFFGIIVRMYAEAGEPHHRPHFHAYAGDATAVVAIDDVELIAGGISRRQERLLLAWTEMHRDELIANWSRLQAGRPPVPVDPLR